MKFYESFHLNEKEDEINMNITDIPNGTLFLYLPNIPLTLVFFWEEGGREIVKLLKYNPKI